MGSAVHDYGKYRGGEHAWALGRFVVPASRLEELREYGTAGWPLSVLCGPDIVADLARVREFRNAGVLEIKVSTPDEIARTRTAISPEATVYFEAPDSLIADIAGAGARAKVRTGGVTAEAFPSSRDLARFLETCARYQVPFKATAGLHHPLRAGPMHGFLNVFLGAVFLYLGLEPALLPLLLEETSGDAFRFDDDGVAWRGHRATNQQIHDARERFAIAFGSCSFDEPIEDLKALHLL